MICLMYPNYDNKYNYYNTHEHHINLIQYVSHIDGHESKPANSNFSKKIYLINSKVIPFYTMC